MLGLMERRLGWDPGPERLGDDVSAARRLTLGRNELVHLLYGDFDHFYAGRLRGLGHLRGNSLVSTFHLPPAELERLPPGTYQFERIDAAVALGRQLADYLRDKAAGVPVFRASLGVDIRAWHPAQDRRAPDPVCAFVGSYLRDFSVLRDVIQLVVREEPTARFEVVTSPHQVELLAGLPNVRARAGIPDVDLRSVYQRAWVHVLPLVDCVANNALLEGMACGLPTVTTAVGDVLDYTGGRGAICVASGDSQGMADEVLKLIGDAGHRERLGRAAREVAETMSLETVAQRHADIYTMVAERKRGGRWRSASR